MGDLLRVPFVLMRGGSSKPPEIVAFDLSDQVEAGDRVLISAMGSGNPLDIDGGHPLNSKVAIVSPSRRRGADVDYLFAQFKVEQRIVDTSPNRGNMLAGAGPFSIESGMVPTQEGTTREHIFKIRLIDAEISTSGRKVVYYGNASIDSLPGPAAAIHLASPGQPGREGQVLVKT